MESIHDSSDKDTILNCFMIEICVVRISEIDLTLLCSNGILNAVSIAVGAYSAGWSIINATPLPRSSFFPLGPNIKKIPPVPAPGVFLDA